MWLFYLYDGIVIGTTSEYMVPYLQKRYHGEIRMESYHEDMDAAIEIVDFVEE